MSQLETSQASQASQGRPQEESLALGTNIRNHLHVHAALQSLADNLRSARQTQRDGFVLLLRENGLGPLGVNFSHSGALQVTSEIRREALRFRDMVKNSAKSAIDSLSNGYSDTRFEDGAGI